MKILSIVVILLSFLQCKSVKLDKGIPFEITSASYTNWDGGQAGVSGTRVEIKLKTASNIIFDSLYFQNKVTKVEVKNNKETTLLMGHFNTSKRNDRDFILDMDSKNELHNPIPERKKFPFKLKENEAIIRYRISDTVRYFKIENVQKQKINIDGMRIQ
ncbi:hypothetical protein [Polaribacter sp.]|uniref:hypothetical protein n=1 Tax=Polaribacter sp. TaxID=1920175 RepID=UPI003F4ABD85